MRRGVRRERGVYRLVPKVKTRNAWRTLVVPEPALATIPHPARPCRSDEARRRRLARPDPGLVVPTPTGGPWDPSNVRDELTELCETVGIRRITPNELRHTAKALLDDAHVDPVIIRNVMGHSNEWMQDSYGDRTSTPKMATSPS